jgi:hypothetical protein
MNFGILILNEGVAAPQLEGLWVVGRGKREMGEK